MKILILSQNYYPQTGGLEIHARQVAQGFRSRNHEVTVGAINFRSINLPSRLEKFYGDLLAPSYPSHSDGDIPVISLSPNWFDRFRLLPLLLRAISRFHHEKFLYFGYKFYALVYLPKLHQLIQDSDIVHLIGHETDYFAWATYAVCQQLEKPLVCTPILHPELIPLSAVERYTFSQNADAVIAFLEGDRKFLTSLLGVPNQKIHIVGVSPNLPPTVYPEQFREKYKLSNVPIILYVGRMVSYKGATSILEATSHVWNVIPQAHFIFIGPHSKESTEWFNDTDPRILYLGKVSLQEKADALAACNIFCMPSMSEILPTVYLEAWSYGKPVIGGEAIGLPELVEGNHAGIAVKQDPNYISKAIIKLLLDPKLADHYGSSGKNLVENKYTNEVVISSLESIYKRLC